MKKNLFFTVLLFVAALAFTSCDKDDDEIIKPEIKNLELGSGNSKIAYAGTDVHVQAEIVALSKIDKIIINIHPESGSGWELEKIFSNSSGQINTTFHEHLDISSEASSGKYHFHLKVVDMLGNSTELEETLEIKIAEDKQAPVITVISRPAEKQEFSSGEKITVSAKVTDNLELKGCRVNLTRKSDKKQITMLHTHDFTSPREFEYTVSIVVGAEKDNDINPAEIGAWTPGEYEITFGCKDAAGNQASAGPFLIIIK